MRHHQHRPRTPSRFLRRSLVRDDRGETLIEALASILIATLSVALLFTCFMASSRMERDAETVGIEHYGALSNADTQPSPATDTGTVTVSRIDPSNSDPLATPIAEMTGIGIYGGEGMFSYKR